MEMRNTKMRKIAIISDVHALLEPLEAVLEDMKKRGITEIYSLGDNIGVGPNPSEVLELLERYDVKSVRGNSEEYCLLGHEAFDYFNQQKKLSQNWTLSKLSEEQLKRLKLFPVFYELVLGGKKIALCHFANDIRIDYRYDHSVWEYQDKIKNQLPFPSEQFRYTNSPEQKRVIALKCDYLRSRLAKEGNNPVLLAELNALLSATNEPLFDGQTIDTYDEVIQGHVHYKLEDFSLEPPVHTIHALGIAYNDDEPADLASYVVLNETETGYEMEEILVPFDRDKMLMAIENSDMPDKSQIKRFVRAI